MLMHQKVDKLQDNGLGPIAISEELGIPLEDTMRWIRVAKVQRRKDAARQKKAERKFTKIAYAGSHRQGDYWHKNPDERKTTSQRAYELYVCGDDVGTIAGKLGVCRRTATSYIANERNRLKASRPTVLVPYAGAN